MEKHLKNREWSKICVSGPCACLAFLSILCSFNLCRFCAVFTNHLQGETHSPNTSHEFYSVITFYHFFEFLFVFKHQHLTSPKTQIKKRNFSSNTYFIFWRSSCALAKAASASLALCSACFNCSRSITVSFKPLEHKTFVGSQRSSISEEMGRKTTKHLPVKHCFTAAYIPMMFPVLLFLSLDNL